MVTPRWSNKLNTNRKLKLGMTRWQIWQDTNGCLADGNLTKPSNCQTNVSENSWLARAIDIRKRTCIYATCSWYTSMAPSLCYACSKSVGTNRKPTILCSIIAANELNTWIVIKERIKHDNHLLNNDCTCILCSAICVCVCPTPDSGFPSAYVIIKRKF